HTKGSHVDTGWPSHAYSVRSLNAFLKAIATMMNAKVAISQPSRRRRFDSMPGFSVPPMPGPCCLFRSLAGASPPRPLIHAPRSGREGRSGRMAGGYIRVSCHAVVVHPRQFAKTRWWGDVRQCAEGFVVALD